MAEAGIGSIIIGDAASILKDYRDWGDRSLFSLDLLLSPATAKETLTLLPKIDWYPQNDTRDRLQSTYPHGEF